MKRIVFSIMALLLMKSAYANVVSFDPLVTANDVTIGWLNDSFYTIYNSHNSGIESVNIMNGTIISDDMADSANPVVRDSELIGDYVYSGLLPATDAGLTSDISAGTCYVSGNRIVKSATSHTYTASKDTWVFINHVGAYQFKAVNTGDSQPTTDSNHILLAKVVTDGDNITSVTDYAQRTPTNMRIYTNYNGGVRVSYDTATTVKIVQGEIELGTEGKRRKNDSEILLTMPTDLDTGNEANSTYYYVFAYPDPDTSTKFLGKFATISTDASGITNERFIGWFYNDAYGNISRDSVGNYRGDGSNSPNIARTYVSNDTVMTTATVYANVDGLTVRFFSSGRPCIFTGILSGRVTAGGTATLNTMFNLDGEDLQPSQLLGGGSQAGYDQQVINQYICTPKQGTHTLIFRARTSAETFTVKERTLMVVEQ